MWICEYSVPVDHQRKKKKNTMYVPSVYIIVSFNPDV